MVLRRTLLMAVGVSSLLVHPVPAGAQNASDISNYVEDVLLGNLSKGSRGHVVKWHVPIRIGLVSTTGEPGQEREQFAALATAVDQINRAIEIDGKALIIGLDNLPQPPRLNDVHNLGVFFAPRLQFYEVARAHGLEMDVARSAEALIWWGSAREHSPVRTALLVDNEIDGDELKQLTLSSLLGTLGLSGQSSKFKDSIFYSERGFSGAATRLSVLDAKLVRFFTRYVEPGDDREKVRAAFDKYWHTLD